MSNYKPHENTYEILPAGTSVQSVPCMHDTTMRLWEYLAQNCAIAQQQLIPITARLIYIRYCRVPKHIRVLVCLLSAGSQLCPALQTHKTCMPRGRSRVVLSAPSLGLTALKAEGTLIKAPTARAAPCRCLLSRPDTVSHTAGRLVICGLVVVARC